MYFKRVDSVRTRRLATGNASLHSVCEFLAGTSVLVVPREALQVLYSFLCSVSVALPHEYTKTREGRMDLEFNTGAGYRGQPRSHTQPQALLPDRFRHYLP